MLALVRSDDACIYMAGNSLGLLPKKAREIINQELDVWSTRSVYLFPLVHPCRSTPKTDNLQPSFVQAAKELS